MITYATWARLSLLAFRWIRELFWDVIMVIWRWIQASDVNDYFWCGLIHNVAYSMMPAETGGCERDAVYDCLLNPSVWQINAAIKRLCRGIKGRRLREQPCLAQLLLQPLITNFILAFLSVRLSCALEFWSFVILERYNCRDVCNDDNFGIANPHHRPPPHAHTDTYKLSHPLELLTNWN